LNENDKIRLVPVPLDGSSEKELSFPGAGFVLKHIAARAIRSAGVILKTLAVGEWDWAAGVLQPDTEKWNGLNSATRSTSTIPPGRQMAHIDPGYLTTSSLWRFKLTN
jgi:hypothetical protein